MGSYLGKQSVKEQIKEEIALLNNDNSYELNKIKEENDFLKKTNTRLEEQINSLQTNIIAENGLSLLAKSKKEIKIISEQKIDEYINNILKNPDTNISWLPDVVEKKIYKNIAMISLNILETTLENSNIQLFGHKISFVMDPIVENNEINNL